MDRRDVFATGALLGAAGLLVPPAAAQTPASGGSTLDRIIRDKKIRITAEVTSPPFGILDRNNQPDGSEIATARRLAQDLGVEVDLVQVTGPQRIPALLAGRADVAISSLSITLARAQTVAFANPHGALSIVITAPERVAISGPGDLAGKRIGITRATLEEATVPRSAPPDARIVFFDDIAATIQALVSGQVDAAGMSAFAAKSVADRNPRAGLVNKYTVTTAFYAPAVRQADHELRHWINTWIMLGKQNGVLAEIYQRYTGVELVALPLI
jgi:polar amino acid transport system substrate-binding protein